MVELYHKIDSWFSLLKIVFDELILVELILDVLVLTHTAPPILKQMLIFHQNIPFSNNTAHELYKTYKL